MVALVVVLAQTKATVVAVVDQDGKVVVVLVVMVMETALAVAVAEDREYIPFPLHYLLMLPTFLRLQEVKVVVVVLQHHTILLNNM